MKQMKLWMLATILTSCGLMMPSSCSNEDNTDVPPTDEVESQLLRITLREKVGQMFYVRPECLDTTIHFNRSGGIDQSVDDITKIRLQAVNEMMRKVNEKYPVGGIKHFPGHSDTKADTHFGYACSKKVLFSLFKPMTG